jgi:hypothetical protein
MPRARSRPASVLTLRLLHASRRARPLLPVGPASGGRAEPWHAAGGLTGFLLYPLQAGPGGLTLMRQCERRRSHLPHLRRPLVPSARRPSARNCRSSPRRPTPAASAPRRCRGLAPPAAPPRCAWRAGQGAARPMYGAGKVLYAWTACRSLVGGHASAACSQRVPWRALTPSLQSGAGYGSSQSKPGGQSYGGGSGGGGSAPASSGPSQQQPAPRYGGGGGYGDRGGGGSSYGQGGARLRRSSGWPAGRPPHFSAQPSWLDSFPHPKLLCWPAVQVATPSRRCQSLTCACNGPQLIRSFGW